MKLQSALYLSWFLCLPLAAAPPAKVKLENKDGRTIEATVLSISADAVHVRRADGKEFDVLLSTLKPASVEIARAALPAAEPPAGKDAPASKETDRNVERPLPKGEPVRPEDIPEKVIVKSGQTVIAAFTETPTGLTKPVVVEKDPGETPCFKVEFEERKPSDKITFANVLGTFDKTVAVKCLARNKGSKKWYRTSIIPLQKGLPCGESWGDDVEVLVFYDFAWEKE